MQPLPAGSGGGGGAVRSCPRRSGQPKRIVQRSTRTMTAHPSRSCSRPCLRGAVQRTRKASSGACTLTRVSAASRKRRGAIWDYTNATLMDATGKCHMWSAPTDQERPRLALRSGDKPLGLPGLSSPEAKRVELANKVYRTAVAALMECYLLGVSVSIENPERSWIWAVLAALVKEAGHCGFSRWYHDLVNVNFDACMHGHTRAKATRLRASAGLFEHLAVRCDGGHRRSSWDVRKVNGSWAFPSAGEAEYSPTLAKRIVGAVAAKV